MDYLGGGIPSGGTLGWIPWGDSGMSSPWVLLLCMLLLIKSIQKNTWVSWMYIYIYVCMYMYIWICTCDIQGEMGSVWGIKYLGNRKNWVKRSQ